MQWWKRYQMMPHIREHSMIVADVASCIAEKAAGLDPSIHPQAVRASALLHDLGKTYTIRYGGNHSQIGGALVQELTGNPVIAQGVLHHVCWPGKLDVAAFFLPLTVIYADKRVKHTEIVSLDERYGYILERYGTTAYRQQKIACSLDQVRSIEKQLGELIGDDLHACTFDRRRLV
ncbi:MAG: HD domain-containing protein [Desulfovibrionales bacterium]